jgi:hypothetical protein
MDSAFGWGRVIVVLIIVWMVACLLVKPQAVQKPVKWFVYYSFHVILLKSFLPNLNLGTVPANQSALMVKYIGVFGVLLVALFLDVLPVRERN